MLIVKKYLMNVIILNKLTQKFSDELISSKQNRGILIEPFSFKIDKIRFIIDDIVKNDIKIREL